MTSLRSFLQRGLLPVSLLYGSDRSAQASRQNSEGSPSEQNKSRASCGAVNRVIGGHDTTWRGFPLTFANTYGHAQTATSAGNNDSSVLLRHGNHAERRRNAVSILASGSGNGPQFPTRTESESLCLTISKIGGVSGFTKCSWSWDGVPSDASLCLLASVRDSMNAAESSCRGRHSPASLWRYTKR